MVALARPESQTLGAIYRAYEESRETFDNFGLPISMLGNECDRALWLLFRWTTVPEQHDGKKIRLFQTGDREETRLIEDLGRAGIEVSGQQEKVRAIGGHLRGKLDGKAVNVPEAPKTVHVIECKTSNDKKFKQIVTGVKSRKTGEVSRGVKEQAHTHYVQSQMYMHLTGLTRCLYILENKNTDEIYIERIEYDPAFALKLVARAEAVITANRAPGKVADDRSRYPCVMCHFADVCHGEAFGRVNCRTCVHSTPIIEAGDAARWRCERFGHDLTFDKQKEGCPAHLFLPDLVPGEQVDAGEDWISYTLPDGTVWRDGVQEPRQHQPVEHDNCTRPSCPICDGGLVVCTVCNGTEGSLPTECPGEAMTEEQQESIIRGGVDFVGGRWVDHSASRESAS